MDMQNEYQRLGIPHSPVSDLEIGNAFGVPLVRCPECGIIWTRQFAPEICIECGTRVTDRPTEGFSEHLEFMKRIGSPCPIFNCPKCNLTIPENVRHQMKECFRCYTPIDVQTHTDIKLPTIKSLISKIMAKL